MKKKKAIQLTENKLESIITESIRQVLDEMGYKMASLAFAANYNATIDYNSTEVTTMPEVK